jgi:hypothetical protein
MLAGIHDIYAEQGSEYTIAFQYFGSDDTALDILPTYENVRFVVRRSAIPQEKNLFELSYDDNIEEGYLSLPLVGSYGTILVSGEEVTITISTETMTTVYPGPYFYYLFLETSTDVVDCLLKGRFVVEAP